MPRARLLTRVALLLAAAVVAGVAVGRTSAEFSSTAVNPGNSFTAAASFGAAAADGVVVKSGASATSYTGGVLADAPVAYWRFGEASGAATAVDASGNGRHGTIPTVNPKPSSVPGFVGDGDKALRWDDSGDGAVTVPHAAPLQLNGAFTIEFWVEGKASLTSPGERVILDKGGNPDANGWRITYDTAGTFRLRRNNIAVSSTVKVLTNNYTMRRYLAVTFNGATVRWYIDGVLDTSTPTTFPSSTGTGLLSVADAWTFPDETTIDEPALYSTALSELRVNAHFKAAKMLTADVCAGYRVYANVTDGGSPATGVTSVTANLSSITPGGTAVPLTAGSYTMGGVNYGYRSAPLRTGVVQGSYGYSLTWVDGGGSHTRSNLTATVADPVPITPQWLTGFEPGVLSTPDLFSTATGGGTGGASGKNGTKGLVMDKASSGTDYVAKDGFTATTVLSFALKIDTMPTTDVTSLAMFNTSSTPLYLGLQRSGAKFTLRWGANGPSVALSTVVAGAWHTLDLRVDVSSNPNTAEWRIDEVDQPPVSLAGGAQTVTDVRLGSSVLSDQYGAYYDDVVHSRALVDYPIGPVRVLPSRPNALASSFFIDNFANEDGTAITSASWNRLDDSYMDAFDSDGVRQETTSGFLVVGTEDTTEVCVRGAQAVVSQHKTASQGNNAAASVYLGSDGQTIWSGDSTFTPNLGHKTVVVSPFGAVWSPVLLNGVHIRLGEATDVNPQPYWDALLIEYATSG